MTKKPNLKTLAHAAGVSVPTASQVMRGTGRISDETRKKVLKAAEHLHYVPDGRAASMRSGEKREIGMLIHRIANPFNAEVISGVSDHLEGHGYLVSILDSRDDVHHQKKNLEAFIRSSRGGLIWVPAHETPKTTIDMLRTHSDVRQERIKGFKLALSENNLDQCIIWDAPDDKLSGVYELDRLLEQYPNTTALICNGDMVALGACFALQKTGKAPGRDLSIIGFDDIQDAALATPALSTISTRPYELGALLAKTILDRISDPSQPVKTSQIETQLILRDTTAAPT